MTDDHSVMIDGQRYIPDRVVTTQFKIGVGVTTRNRWEVLGRTLEDIRSRVPEGTPIVVVDDASDKPGVISDANILWHRFENNVGIARAKNKCLEVLYNEGVDHMFLFDDDAWPIAEDWYLPYCKSPEPHLMRIFPDLSGPTKLRDIRVIYGDPNLLAYTGPRGMMLYVERRVLDVVGGMDVAYGKWGYEHGDWSNRIHNAGLTTWRFADVNGGEKLIYSLDEHEQIDRSTNRDERHALAKVNVKRYHANWNSSAYQEFRESKDVVLTCLFTTRPDPQRPGTNPKLSALDTLRDSLGADRHFVVIVDDPKNGNQVITLGTPNLYVQRWVSYWNWLRDHPETGFVWCVDGTDVEMLRDPFDLRPGVLYLGDEPVLLDSEWFRKNPSQMMVRLLEEHGGKQTFNAGLVGGDRTTVMGFIHAMLSVYESNQIDVFHKKDTDFTATVNDMGLLNYAAHHWAGEIEHGVFVNTIFKANQVNKVARWKHK